MICSAADKADSKTLIDFGTAGVGQQLKAGCDQVTYKATADGLVVNIAAGDNGYPGLSIKPNTPAWDLSKFGHIEAKVTNTGDTTVSLSLRVDNAGHWKTNPWNCESKSIKPGETSVIKVIFGYQYGMKPGFKLNSSEVINLLVFSNKAKKDMQFRIDSIIATGSAGEKPPIKPENVRIKPVNGYLVGGADIKLDVEKQTYVADGVKAVPVTIGGQQTVGFVFPGTKSSHKVALTPIMGAWNLGLTTEIVVKLTNKGKTTVIPSAQAFSGQKDGTVKVDGEPLRPGASCEITIPYEPEKPWEGPHHDILKAHVKDKVAGTGTDFASQKVRKIMLYAKHDGEASLLVDSIRAVVSNAKTPEWLGKRPPVEGDWTLAFDEQFNGNSIDLQKWNYYGPNWWGVSKLTHWSKDNVIVKDGIAKMHFEKKTGWHNDDPETKHESPYTGGYLDTYGKWTQKYGYFETRIKLPVAQGLWPAFWLMPDRGVEAGEQWKRADTGNGGMEFDIMEHLTSWGPYRYTIAMHWDGYQKNHKATGATVYFKPDADGFVTSGLLWTPGLAVFYCQGKEVARWENQRICSVPSNMIFTMPVGGWENAKSPTDSELPVDLEIDYVRVWQRNDLMEK
jgi:beta-glucanase (GH16 family)